MVPTPTPEEVKEQYRLRHNELARLWRAKNPGRAAAAAAKHRAKKPWSSLTPEQKEKWVARTREWHKRNPGRAAEYTKKYRQSLSPEVLREQMRTINKRWNDANRHKRRAIKLKQYGLTPESFLEMLAKQGGRCAICAVVLDPELKTGRDRPCVDHDHATGEVRGILCHGCNPGLGHFQDDPRILHMAALYLEQRKGKRG